MIELSHWKKSKTEFKMNGDTYSSRGEIIPYSTLPTLTFSVADSGRSRDYYVSNCNSCPISTNPASGTNDGIAVIETGDDRGLPIIVPEVPDVTMRQIHTHQVAIIVRENGKIATRAGGTTGNGIGIAATAGEGTTTDRPGARGTAICLMTDHDGMEETEIVSGSAIVIGQTGEGPRLLHGRENPPLT